MKQSIFWDFLTGYEKSDIDLKESSAKAALDKTFKSIGISGVNSSFSHFSAKSRLSAFLNRLCASFIYTPARTYGAFLLAFGVTTLLINFVIGYFRDFSTSDTSVFPLICGAVVAIIGVFLSFSNKPLCLALQDLAVTDYILFEFLRIKRSGRAPSDLAVLSPLVCILFGVFASVLGMLVSVPIVLAVLLALIIIALSFSSPEFTLLLTLLALPYLHLFDHPTVYLAILVGLCTVSYMRKVMLGKRIYSLEQYDVIILLFMAFILVSGIFNQGLESFESSLILLVLTLGYVPASNLITNRRLSDCAFNAIIFSSIPPAVLAIVEYALGIAEFNYLDPSFIGVISGRATSTFDNPNVLAVYLIITVIFSLGYALERRSAAKKAAYLGIFAINLTALVFTWSRGAWIAIAISLAVFLALRLRRHSGLVIIALALIPYVIFILPESITLRLLSVFDTHDTSSSYRLSIYRSSLNMLRENLFGGVGIGPSSFSSAFLGYAESGVVAPHSHNLFLEIACEAGIFALVLFVFLLIVRIRHHISYLPYLQKSSVGSLSSVVAASIFALVLFGMTDYIFYDAGMYFAFFTVFGIGSALLRIAKREHDDRIGYYSNMDNNASAIDVSING